VEWNRLSEFFSDKEKKKILDDLKITNYTEFFYLHSLFGRELSEEEKIAIENQNALIKIRMIYLEAVKTAKEKPEATAFVYVPLAEGEHMEYIRRKWSKQ